MNTPASDQDPLARDRRGQALAGLCLTQVVGWGVLYYAFPVALAAIAADTGWSETAATAAFSTGLLVSAVAGIPVGHLLDRHGPRLVMTGGSVVAVPAVMLVALAPNPAAFFAGWILAGLAMAAVFYPAAFAALTRWYGPDRVRALTVLTLAGGLASTVFAPVTALLLQQHSWRVTYLILAAALAVLTIPTHALLLTPRWASGRGTRAARADPGVGTVVRSGGFLLLCARLTLTGFALHAAGLALIPLLSADGLPNAGIPPNWATARTRKWPHRWRLDPGSMSLGDAARSGRPPRFTPVQVARVKAPACIHPADHALPLSRWSCPDLARQAVTVRGACCCWTATGWSSTGSSATLRPAGDALIDRPAVGRVVSGVP